jgi:solute carrier family 25 (mitochondrial uncoupling protein), member 8/9
VSAGLHRQVLYGGLRIGLYDPIKRLITGDSPANPSLLTKIVAGMTTGALAICVASPTDLVKVRRMLLAHEEVCQGDLSALCEGS